MARGSSRHDDDLRLMRRIDRGDVTTFDELYAKYAPVVRRFLASRNGFYDLDYLVQEVFARVWSGRGQFRGDSSVETYLLGIADNALLNEHRRVRKQPIRLSAWEQDNVPSDDHSTLEDAACRQEIANAIREAASRLPPGQREAFDLVHFRGLTVAEAAKRSECSPRPLSDRLYRARKHLRQWLRHLQDE